MDSATLSGEGETDVVYVDAAVCVLSVSIHYCVTLYTCTVTVNRFILCVRV